MGKKFLPSGCNKFGDFFYWKLSQHDVLEEKSVLGNVLLECPATHHSDCGA